MSWPAPNTTQSKPPFAGTVPALSSPGDGSQLRGKGRGQIWVSSCPQQVNEAAQQLPELFAVLGTGFPSFPPTTTFKPPRPALLLNPPPHFTLPKTEPCRYPEPPQPLTLSPSSRKSTESKGQAGTETIINLFRCFTRPSVGPCCPIPCPSRAYPRTSLLFWANQTQPGYTLTRLPAADKALPAGWVLGR